MATVVAIEVAGPNALLVTAERGEGNTINLLNVMRVPIGLLDDQVEDFSSIAETAQDGDSELDAKVETNGRGKQPLDIHTLLGINIDSALAVINPQKVLHRLIELPFNNSKKVDQTAPLQIQDEVPFELDGFVVDNMILSRNSSGQFNVLSSMTPALEIAESLAALSSIGVDPKVITTRASAVSGLHLLLNQPAESNYGLLEFGAEQATLALFLSGDIRQLRSFSSAGAPTTESPEQGSTNDQAIKQLLIHVNCSIIQVETEQEQKLDTLFVIGSKQQFDSARRYLRTPVKVFDFNTSVRNRTDGDLDAQQLSWAIGLFASEFKPSATRLNRLVDFRKGPFAFRKAWKDFATALQGEMFFIIFAIAFGIGWCVSMIYDSDSNLAILDQGFASIGRSVVPNETIPRLGEVAFLEGRLASLEEQLGDIGSLSTLSPLETLNQLSIALPREIDIEIDSLAIGQSRVTIRGSVEDIPAAGRLETALLNRKDHFCSVDVQTKGVVPGSSRVNFVSEIELCK